jgi:phosphoribosylformylglycinamidine cyclo-ligase
MPGMYAKGDYDLAGFAVGAVERGQQITGSDVKAGDVVLGLGSSGVHSNGYSLVRKVVSVAGLEYSAKAPFDSSKALGEALLAPTKIYVKSCLAAIRAGGVKALAHITGGGLLENIPRVLPKDCACEIDAASWQQPPVFAWLRKTAGIDAQEMARTFNCGIGMVLVIAPDRVDAVRGILQGAGETVAVIGTIRPRSGDEAGCLVINTGKW